jgi:hypothetical protein
LAQTDEVRELSFVSGRHVVIHSWLPDFKDTRVRCQDFRQVRFQTVPRQPSPKEVSGLHGAENPGRRFYDEVLRVKVVRAVPLCLHLPVRQMSRDENPDAKVR